MCCSPPFFSRRYTVAAIAEGNKRAYEKRAEGEGKK